MTYENLYFVVCTKCRHEAGFNIIWDLDDLHVHCEHSQDGFYIDDLRVISNPLWKVYGYDKFDRIYVNIEVCGE